jgi:hypothetical protein
MNLTALQLDNSEESGFLLSHTTSAYIEFQWIFYRSTKKSELDQQTSVEYWPSPTMTMTAGSSIAMNSINNRDIFMDKKISLELKLKV